jgi:ribosomal protein L12E/L44/L45/RPP1/RPP2
VIFGDTVTDENQTELIVGLSNGEKKDLEELITSFKEKGSSAPPDAPAEDVHYQIKSMSAKLAHFGDVLLKFDAKMKSFYEILLLSHKKSEIMNQRIDTIVEIMKIRENR